MSDTIVSALSGESVLHASALATVTPNCLLIRDAIRGTQTIISVDRVTAMRRIDSTNPGLLVIAFGLFTIAAASYASKQGVEITAIIALLGALFVMAYMGTRRAAVLFVTSDEKIETIKGSFREATSLIRAVSRVRGAQIK